MERNVYVLGLYFSHIICKLPMYLNLFVISNSTLMVLLWLSADIYRKQNKIKTQETNETHAGQLFAAEVKRDVWTENGTWW